MNNGMGGSFWDSLASVGTNLLTGALNAGASSLTDHLSSHWGFEPPSQPAAAPAPTPAAKPEATTTAMVAKTAKATWPIVAVAGSAALVLGAILYAKSKK